ncbi:cysteine proteinase [Fistulina hepatica ATCC 64428]|uniref:ubiquitinyl hydrolase 1 n=1 Tax=Fistulina hepatica ATCC 64428 TaxID=1128425 RepID=A0A0D7AC36_9AGAR|nr:cysteine proteinase [Fistulina hepatica ATCC 64428]
MILIRCQDPNNISNAQLYEMNQELLKESMPERPLMGAVSPMSALREEYERGSASFVRQIDWLTKHGFRSLRRTRGDGDCFYRSVAFAYLERVVASADSELAVAQAISVLEGTKPMLREAGFEDMVFEDFYDELLRLVNQVVIPNEEGALLTMEGLLEAFCAPEISNSIVFYLRLITSAKIRRDSDVFAPFLMHPETGEMMAPREFCEHFVEAVGKEADHVQMTALSQALGLDIDVAYLDGHSSDGTVDFVQFRNAREDNSAQPLVLLYRPGHYDLLVRE